jgi:hypothetical protein
MTMRKLVYIFAAAAFLGAATPASAQFFFAGGNGFGFGVGADPWWGGPTYRSGWWGGPGYRSAWWGGPVYRPAWGPVYRSAWWGEPAWSAPAWGRPVRMVRWGGPAYRQSFAMAGCRTVSVRRVLPSGRVVIRRTRMC